MWLSLNTKALCGWYISYRCSRDPLDFQSKLNKASSFMQSGLQAKQTYSWCSKKCAIYIWREEEVRTLPKEKANFRKFQKFTAFWWTLLDILFFQALTVSPSPAAIALNNSSQVIGTMPLIRKDKILFYYPFAYDPTGLQETFSFLKYIQYPGKCC